MESTQRLIAEYNKILIGKLFPDEKGVVEGMIIDPNDRHFGMSFQDIANEYLKEILQEQSFLTELEQMKHSLKSD